MMGRLLEQKIVENLGQKVATFHFSLIIFDKLKILSKNLTGGAAVLARHF
jgi:hypothetical protein